MDLSTAKHSLFYQFYLIRKQIAGNLLWIIVVLFFPVFSYSQSSNISNDSLPPITEQGQVISTNDSQLDNDQVPEEEPKEKHSPQRAAMLSATLPGLGQIYNRKYWKVPAVYAGFGAVIYFLEFNNSRYQEFRRAWVARVDGNPNTTDDFPVYSTDQLERATKYYQRNLEITYISAAAIYLLNILDATVDAHLLDFDVSEDLSVNVRPTVIHFSNQNTTLKSNAPVAGVKFSFKF
jgi:hypothetical protein